MIRDELTATSYVGPNHNPISPTTPTTPCKNWHPPQFGNHPEYINRWILRGKKNYIAFLCRSLGVNISQYDEQSSRISAHLIELSSHPFIPWPVRPLTELQFAPGRVASELTRLVDTAMTQSSNPSDKSNPHIQTPKHCQQPSRGLRIEVVQQTTIYQPVPISGKKKKKT